MKVRCPHCKRKWADDGGTGRVSYYQCPDCGTVFSVQASVQLRLEESPVPIRVEIPRMQQ